MLVFFRIIARFENPGILADDLRYGIPRQLHELRVDVFNGSLQIGNDDGTGIVLDHTRKLEQFSFLFLFAGQIANDADEQEFILDFKLTDREKQRNNRAILAQPLNLTACAHDAGDPCFKVSFHGAIVQDPIGFGYEPVDIFADHF